MSAKNKSRNLIIILNLILCSCSVPNSKLTSVSINARVLDENGQPIPNKKLEVILPASYGLKEVDIEYYEPEDLEQLEQSATVKTDLSGNFSYTFNNIKYNTAYWFFPPLGNFPKQPPNPAFVINFLDQINTIYSVGWDENDKLNYAVMRSGRLKSKKPPYFLSGKIFRQLRGDIPACIADFSFKKSN